MDAVNTLLKQMLDGAALRNRAIANNIANADTAGYRRRDVSFLSELNEAVRSGDDTNIMNWKPTMSMARREEPIRLEQEFASLSDNQLLYHTSADLLARRYTRLRTAIFGRPQ
jgi:flagellar basal-body rod protein FlgB